MIPDRDEHAVVRSLALMSTLAVAVDTVHFIRERRLGRDPADQEAPEVARPYLRAAAEESQRLLVALRASRVARLGAGKSDASVRLSRHLNELLLLRRLSRLLHVTHQRLLSLYPMVDDGVVEDVRRLGSSCDLLLQSGSGGTAAQDEDADRFIEQVRHVTDTLLDAV